MKRILFHRFDDIGKYRIEVEYLLKELDKENIPTILGIIPSRLDSKMANVIKLLNNCILFQHGVTHKSRIHQGWFDEFPANLKKKDILNKLLKGKTKLEDIFDRKIDGYIPPWNNTSAKTIAALEKLGFKYYSSQLNKSVDTAMNQYHIHYDVAAKYLPNIILKNLDELRAMIINKDNCVELPIGIMYHPCNLDIQNINRLLNFITSLQQLTLSYIELRKFIK